MVLDSFPLLVASRGRDEAGTSGALALLPLDFDSATGGENERDRGKLGQEREGDYQR